jgi:hypothetical protein
MSRQGKWPPSTIYRFLVGVFLFGGAGLAALLRSLELLSDWQILAWPLLMGSLMLLLVRCRRCSRSLLLTRGGMGSRFTLPDACPRCGQRVD